MMKRMVTSAVLSAVLLAGACHTTKSRAVCDQDVERLKLAISDTAFYFEALPAELIAANKGLKDCKSQVRTCEADAWFERLTQLRLQQSDLRSQFSRSVALYEQESCFDYAANDLLNPPNPTTYQGYFSNYEKAEIEVNRLIGAFRPYVD